MSATDVLDAYLDQHCKRTFQSSKNVLRGRPPRHGVRSKSITSLTRQSPGSEPLFRAAQPLSPASKPAKNSNGCAHADLPDYTAAADRPSKLAAVSSVPDKPAKRMSSPLLPDNHSGHQATQKQSVSPQHSQQGTAREQKTSLWRTNSSPTVYGELFHKMAEQPSLTCLVSCNTVNS